MSVQSAKCPRCGRTVRTVKVKNRLVFANHDDQGSMCQGAGTAVNRSAS